ncbi:MAG: AAA family ATPase [Clostridia bacterium]|nr:AAA family ATPase [Clostridia bacterium]
MLYLDSFTFPDAERETSYIMGIRRTCYSSFYPFKILSRRYFERIDFEPVTILYGGNGTGKSTALHVIAEKAGLEREAPYNRTSFFEDYVGMCGIQLRKPIPQGSCIITSDDVFDHMISIRELNDGIDHRRTEVFEEYLENKYSKFQLSSMEDYDQLRKVVRARKKTQSKYVKEELGMNVRTFSNGESAFRYFTNKVTEDRLYLLDEPENSLSPERQMELCQFISDSARFMGCQFVISTHSPFLLSMKGAKIYDLDSDPVDVRKWTELRNVRTYYEFFKTHQSAFEDE